MSGNVNYIEVMCNIRVITLYHHHHLGIHLRWKAIILRYCS